MLRLKVKKMTTRKPYTDEPKFVVAVEIEIPDEAFAVPLARVFVPIQNLATIEVESTPIGVAESA